MNHLTPVTRVIVWSLELMHMFLFLPKASILNISQILSNVTLFKTLLWVPFSPKSPQSSVKAYNSTLWLIAIRYYPSSFSFSLPLCKLIAALGLLHWFLCIDLMFLIHLGCNVSFKKFINFFSRQFTHPFGRMLPSLYNSTFFFPSAAEMVEGAAVVL